MAAEIEKLAAELRNRLPKDHPDQGFLLDTQRRAERYLLCQEQVKELIASKNPNKQRGGLLSRGTHIAEHYRHFKTSPYFSFEEVDTAIEDAYKLSENAVSYGKRLRADLEKYGGNSLGHLCLTATRINQLRREGIFTISGLREAIESDKLWGIRGFGNSLAEIKKELREFDEQVKRQSELE